MTKIFPFSESHKIGLFGNHKKQNTTDLLKISEIKNLWIYQVVSYKVISANIDKIFIDGHKLPMISGDVSGDYTTRIHWNAPNTWTVISSNENIINQILENCSENDFAITDQSHSRVIIQIEGQKSFEIIKKGSPLNLNNFRKNNCASSVYHGMTISIDMIDDNPIKFNLMALRSFSESFYHAITDSALEYGYQNL